MICVEDRVVLDEIVSIFESHGFWKRGTMAKLLRRSVRSAWGRRPRKARNRKMRRIFTMMKMSGRRPKIR